MVVDARCAPSRLGDAADRFGERGGPPRVPCDGQALVLTRHIAVHAHLGASDVVVEGGRFPGRPRAGAPAGDGLVGGGPAAPRAIHELVVVQSRCVAVHHGDAVGELLGFDDRESREHVRVLDRAGAPHRRGLRGIVRYFQMRARAAPRVLGTSLFDSVGSLIAQQYGRGPSKFRLAPPALTGRGRGRATRRAAP